MINVVEFNQLSGTIEYGYKDESLHGEEMNVHTEKFHTLNEFLTLIHSHKLEEIKEYLQVDEVNVEAVCLNTETPDSKGKVELLLMKDEFYGQAIKLS